jgi:hypothetical protein
VIIAVKDVEQFDQQSVEHKLVERSNRVGLRLRVPVLTCDRAWATLDLSLDVRVIR